MSASKIQNKLQDQILNKIGLLLDKPISPKSNKQIIELINHPQSPKQKLMQLLLLKFRGDLILIMLQNYPFIVGEDNKLASIFMNVQKNIMNYENETLKEIWKIIIKIIFVNQNKSKNQNQQVIYKYGYQSLLKQGLKVTNLGKKDKIFQLISENIVLFGELGLKDNIRKVIGTYVEVFSKFPIQVANYVKIIGQLVALIQESNSKSRQNNSNQQNIQKDLLKLQKIPQISTQSLLQISNQLMNILITTKQKPLHSLHNESLSSLQKVLSYKGKQFIKNDLIYSINKMLEIFLYRKGTRGEARKVSVALSKIEEHLNVVNKQKMIKLYSESNLSENRKQQNPVLIQNVINRTNQYLAKYQVNNMVINNQANNEYVLKNNSKFLKKGQGIGGGKTVLQVQTNQRSQSRIVNNKNKKDKYQILLEECLSKNDWNKREQNMFQKNIQNQQKKNKKIIENQSIRNKLLNLQRKAKTKEEFYKNNRNKNAQLFDQFYQTQQYQPESRSKPIAKNKRVQQNNKRRVIPQMQSRSQYYEVQQFNRISKNNYISQNKYSYYQKNDNSTQQCNDQEINQINELIQLAYSYKFSI